MMVVGHQQQMVKPFLQTNEQEMSRGVLCNPTGFDRKKQDKEQERKK
jgi:hypothetical protein